LISVIGVEQTACRLELFYSLTGTISRNGVLNLERKVFGWS
jgi:hypothetical protein